MEVHGETLFQHQPASLPVPNMAVSPTNSISNGFIPPLPLHTQQPSGNNSTVTSSTQHTTNGIAHLSNANNQTNSKPSSSIVSATISANPLTTSSPIKQANGVSIPNDGASPNAFNANSANILPNKSKASNSTKPKMEKQTTASNNAISNVPIAPASTSSNSSQQNASTNTSPSTASSSNLRQQQTAAAPSCTTTPALASTVQQRSLTAPPTNSSVPNSIDSKTSINSSQFQSPNNGITSLSSNFNTAPTPALPSPGSAGSLITNSSSGASAFNNSIGTNTPPITSASTNLAGGVTGGAGTQSQPHSNVTLPMGSTAVEITDLTKTQVVNATHSPAPIPFVDTYLSDLDLPVPNEFIRTTSDYFKVVEVIRTLKRQRDETFQDIEKLKKIRVEALQEPVQFIQDLVNKKLQLPTPTRVIALPQIDWKLYQCANNESKKKKDDTSGDEESDKEDVKVEKSRERLYVPWTATEQQKLEDLLKLYPDEEIASRRWEKIANALGNRTPRQVASRTQKYFIKLAKMGKPVPGKISSIERYIASTMKQKRKQNESFSSDDSDEDSDSDAELHNKNNPKTSLASPKANKPKQLNTSTSLPKSPVSVVKEKYEKKTKEQRLRDPTYYTPPPVIMSDDEEDALQLKDLDEDLKESDEYKELLELLRLKKLQDKKPKEKVVQKPFSKNKEKDKSGSKINQNQPTNRSGITPKGKTVPNRAILTVRHEGYKCDCCGIEPIVGTRWKCSDCPEDEEVDLCNDCKLSSNFETQFHTRNHHCTKIEEPERVPYYLNYNHSYLLDEPNYLDPTFMSEETLSLDNS